MNALALELAEQLRLLVRVYRDARRGLGGFVKARGVGGADVDPGAQAAGEVEDPQRRLLRCPEAAREIQAFGELEAVGEHARHQVVLRLRGMARDLQLERLVDAAVHIRKADREVVKGAGEAQRFTNLRVKRSLSPIAWYFARSRSFSR